jgi:hypothetical protein
MPVQESDSELPAEESSEGKLAESAKLPHTRRARSFAQVPHRTYPTVRPSTIHPVTLLAASTNAAIVRGGVGAPLRC